MPRTKGHYMKNRALPLAVRVVLSLCAITIGATPTEAAHETPAVVAVIPIANNPAAIAVNEQTNRVYTVSSVGNNIVWVIDGTTNAIIASVSLGTPSNVSS